PWICCALVASSENGAQLRAAKPGSGVDRDEKKNQSSLTKETRARQKKRARRRIHEIVFPRTEKIDFIARQHMLASGIPELVIEDRMAAPVTQERKHREDNRRYEKRREQYAKSERVIGSTIES